MLTQEAGERGRMGEIKTTFWVGRHKKKKRKKDKKMWQKDIDSEKL